MEALEVVGVIDVVFRLVRDIHAASDCCRRNRRQAALLAGRAATVGQLLNLRASAEELPDAPSHAPPLNPAHVQPLRGALESALALLRDNAAGEKKLLYRMINASDFEVRFRQVFDQLTGAMQHLNLNVNLDMQEDIREAARLDNQVIMEDLRHLMAGQDRVVATVDDRGDEIMDLLRSIATAVLDRSARSLPRVQTPAPRGEEPWYIDPNDIVVQKRPNGRDWILGHGAFGTVYLGKFRTVPVAMKEMLPAAVAHDENLASFRDELDTMFKISHPNIVKAIGGFYDAQGLRGPDALTPTIILEYIDGGTLQDAIINGTLVELRARLSVMREIASACNYLHNVLNMSHRDLKPANVLLTASKIVKLADFGFASVMKSSQLHKQSFKGTVTYCAPELLRGEPYRYSVDSWAFGVTVWEMFSRKPSSKGTEDDNVLADNIVSGLRELGLDDMGRHCPNVVKEIVQGCLIVDPHQRWSFEYILAALDECTESLESRNELPVSLSRKTLPRATQSVPEASPSASTQAASEDGAGSAVGVQGASFSTLKDKPSDSPKPKPTTRRTRSEPGADGQGTGVPVLSESPGRGTADVLRAQQETLPGRASPEMLTVRDVCSGSAVTAVSPQVQLQGRSLSQPSPASHGQIQTVAESPRAKQLDTDEMMRRGDAFVAGTLVRRSDREAFQWYMLAAQKRDARAQNNVGVMLRDGVGTDGRNNVEALKYFRMAANQGHANSQLAVGQMYERGLGGVSKSESEAFRWISLASKQGLPQAQAHLAAFYLEGRLVRPNPREGLRLHREAVSKGHIPSMEALGVIYSEGRPGIEQDEREARMYFDMAAGRRSVFALSSLAYMYTNGVGGPRDEMVAIAMLQEAARLGSRSARHTLSKMFRRGIGCPGGQPQADEALRYLTEAASMGHAESQNDLGMMHYHADGVPQDDERAAQYFEQAAKEGYVRAQRNLANLYLIGRGVPRNKEEALKWLRKAADQGDDEAREVMKQLAPSAASKSEKVLRIPAIGTPSKSFPPSGLLRGKK